MTAPDLDYVQKCVNAAKASKVAVLDTEGSGLSWHKNFVCGWVFAFGPRPDDVFYLPVRHGGGENIPGGPVPKQAEIDDHSKYDHVVDRIIREEIAPLDIHWVGHNIKYDLHMAASHNVWFQGSVEDTQINAALLDENQGKYNLDICCKIMGLEGKSDEGLYQAISDYMARQGVKVAPTRNKAMAYFWRLPADGVATEYAKGDGTNTWNLLHLQKTLLEEEELGRVHNVECRCVRTFFRMERRGVPVNERVLERVEDQVVHDLSEARKALPKGLNVRSAPQIKKLFLEGGYQEEDLPITEKGNPSFKEEWLEPFGGELGAHIITIRKLSNLISTFINGHIKRNLINGRVHPNFNQMKSDEYGTVSGRPSCNDPNMLQIPKRDKTLAPLLRQIFQDELLPWWSADYSQQEYRVFADFAGAKLVLEAYAKDPNTDYHQLVADLLGVERDPSAKRINLGTIYNMGAPKLAKGLNVPTSKAREYLNTMRRMMPEARKFNKVAERIARQRGYVRTILGRRRRFPDLRIAHKAGNGVIQGSSADITKSKMVEIDEFLVSEGARSHIMLQIYDSMEFLYDPDEQHLMKECMRIMNSFGSDDLIQLTVPMKVDISTGISWGHATFPNYEKFYVEK